MATKEQPALYLVNGARTPVGLLNGTLASVTAPQLGSAVLKATLERTGLPADKLNEVIMGCVIPSGIGQAPARQAMIGAGIPTSVAATGISKVCGSGMKAIMVARSEILAGEADVILAGGMESMSQVPHMLKGERVGYRLGHQTLIDGIIHDGLWDPYNDIHMGNCAEICAAKYAFTREAQDAYAKASYERARMAQANGWFKDEIVPVLVPQRKGDPLSVSEDEGPNSVSLDKIGQLKPAFDKAGTVTAGNASSINDGAAAVLLASETAVSQYNLKPMARIIATATHSQDPLWFTTAPVEAIEKALAKAHLSPDDIDCYEVNEAFAIVAMAAMHDVGISHDKMNTRGSGISIGHPIGATGARIVVTLMHILMQEKKRYGVAALCIGGGEATALVIENLSI